MPRWQSKTQRGRRRHDRRTVRFRRLGGAVAPLLVVWLIREVYFGDWTTPLWLLAGLGLLQASAAELQWLTDLSKAQAQAKAENKLLVLYFTGSDW